VREAFIAFFPMYEMARLRFNAVENPANPRRTELHRFNHQRRLLDHTARAVSAPNNDTLYSSARLDLRLGPVVVEMPPMPGRYHSLQFINIHTDNVGIVGGHTVSAHTRASPTATPTHGPEPKPAAEGLRVAVVGPGWTGPVPAHNRRVDSDTHDLWLLVRVLVEDTADIAQVVPLQQAMQLRAPQPAQDYPSQRRAPTQDPEPAVFVDVVAEFLARNPANPAQGAQIEVARRAGLQNGGWAAMSAAQQQAWQQAWPDLTALLRAPMRSQTRVVQGWEYPPPSVGRWGDDLLLRATVALQGIGALDPSEAVYLSTSLDTDGAPLHGSRKYQVRVPPGGLPVRGFWSLTMYEALPDGRLFLTANSIDRFAIGDRTKGLLVEPDGSITLTVQHEPPRDRNNWLPSPAGPFRLMLRAYLPQPELVAGQAPLPRVLAAPQ
jgi:hypothetical protein